MSEIEFDLEQHRYKQIQFGGSYEYCLRVETYAIDGGQKRVSIEIQSEEEDFGAECVVPLSELLEFLQEAAKEKV